MGILTLNRTINRLNLSMGGMGGSNPLLQASFDMPFTDAGGGVANIVPSRGGVTGTFVRATAGASKLSTGLWKLDVASGSPRYAYNGLDTTVTTTGGYFPEGARTNSCLQSRDLTNAAWTKSNLTTAQTSTGIDGGANSCTRCTASAGNGTALQAVVLASAAKAFGVWIKRITGTGEIDITLDNGSTWTNVTGSINAATFTLVQATQTLANPTVGIRIVTAADAIDVDVCDLEDGQAFIGSPIATTVAAVTRNADVLTYPTSPWLNAAAGTLMLSYRLARGLDATSSIWVGAEAYADGNNLIAIDGLGFNAGGPRFFVKNGAVTQASPNATPESVSASNKVAAAWSANDFAIVSNAGTAGTDAAGTIPAVTTFGVGVDFAGLQQPYATISRVTYYPRRLPNTMLVSLTS